MENKTIYHIGQYTFDYKNHLLISPDATRRLTRKETYLLQMLVEYRNKILKRETALKKIWGQNDYFMGRSMDVYISKLRKMLVNDPNVSIVNIHNTGFMLSIKQ